MLELVTLLENGVDFFINNKKVWFYPRVLTIIADWPEAASFCLVYKSSNSNIPCHFCLIRKDDLSNVNLLSSDMILRSHDEMCQHFENNTQKSVCIESVSNFFWNFS